MVTAAKKAGRDHSSARAERTVAYRGIKIPLTPMSGKRSPTAEAIREALRIKSKQSRGESAHG
jgi:hypothetical protein